MSSDNPSGADNQQERPGSSAWLDRIPLDVGHYIAGFVDGEGSFNVPIRRGSGRSLPWRVSLSFNVSQLGAELPEFLRSVLEVGTTRPRPDGVWYFEVTRPSDLAERIFPFFERFELRGPKRRDLEIFQEVTQLVQLGMHLSPQGIEEVLSLRTHMKSWRKETPIGR